MTIIDYRQQLHQIPESSNEEFKTSAYLYEHLQKLNCQIERVGTSLIAYFDFNQAKTIAYRSDIDALTIEEKNEVSYKSTHPKHMHACGHDGHMAMLLAFADYLNTLSTCKYNVVCLFQAAEEVITGAKEILNSNVLDKYEIKAMFGFHLWPKLAAGKIYTKPNELMAMASEIDIKITGKAIHIANFEQGIDAIKVATAILNDIYKYEATIKPKHLLQFGKISGGTIRNIVANKAVINGSMRCYDMEVFKTMQQAVQAICEKHCQQFQADFEIEYGETSAPVINNQDLVNKLNIDYEILEKPVMQAEDFGEYCNVYPAVFMFLGLGDVAALHTANFNFDTKLLNNGLMAYQKLLEINL